MSTQQTFIPKPVTDELDGVIDYLGQGYDLEAARRLAKFDQEYTKTLTPSEVAEYLALRKRLK